MLWGRIKINSLRQYTYKWYTTYMEYVPLLWNIITIKAKVFFIDLVESRFYYYDKDRKG